MLRSDGRQNLLTSVLVAARDDVKEVCLVFGSKILRGSRAVKASASGFEAFSSPNAADLGAAGVLIEMDPTRLRPQAHGAVALPLSLDAPVSMLRLYPGIPAALLRAALAEPIQGLVLEAYGAGTFADADPYLLAALAEGARRGVVIVVVSQCADGRVDLGAYATSGALVRAGAVGGLDMTTEAAYAKLVVLLSEGHPPDEVRAPARGRPGGRAHRLKTRDSALDVADRHRHTAAMLHYELLDRALSHHLLPDAALLLGSRLATRRRLKSEREGGVEAQEDRQRSLVWHMSHGPILEVPERDGRQNSELPAEFFELFLGPRHKYSCALWRGGTTELAAAEEAMLRLTCERAQIEDGMDILDLGCGWGSLSLWLGEQYPNARVTGIAISDAQRAAHRGRGRRARGRQRRDRRLDANSYDPGRSVDRVRLDRDVRAHAQLEGAAAPDLDAPEARRQGVRAGLLASQPRLPLRGHLGGRALLHRRHDALATTCCCASSRTSSCRSAGRSPAPTTRARCARGWSAWTPTPPKRWRVLERDTSGREARRQLAAWRLFMISAAEIWDWHGGDEWLVSHYLLAPRSSSERNEVRPT